MNFSEFKNTVISYLSQNPQSPTRDIAAITPKVNPSTVNQWLKRLIKSGDVVRFQDPHFLGIRYLYSVEAIAAEVEVIEEVDSLQATWNFVLEELSPLLKAMIKANVTPVRIGKNTHLKINSTSSAKLVMYKDELIKTAIAKVIGCEPSDVTLGFTTGPGLATPQEKVMKNVPTHIPNDIKGEFSVKADGTTTISLRGAERLLGISHQALAKAFGGNQKPSKLAQSLMSKGFNVATFGQNGIPDQAFGHIVTYYAYKAGVHCTAQAEAVHDAFEAIGIRTWIQHELGWTPPAKAEIVKAEPSVDMGAIAASIQGLAAAIQQQASSFVVQKDDLAEQRQALREILAGLGQMGQAVNANSQKIIQIESYIEQRETDRQKAIKTLLEIKPDTEAPPKTARDKVIHLVSTFVYAQGSGQPGFNMAWARLYRDIELRCHVSLESERKKLEKAGAKSPKKIDAVDSLGLMETALAIAAEIFSPTIEKTL